MNKRQKKKQLRTSIRVIKNWVTTVQGKIETAIKNDPYKVKELLENEFDKSLWTSYYIQKCDEEIKKRENKNLLEEN